MGLEYEDNAEALNQVTQQALEATTPAEEWSDRQLPPFPDILSPEVQQSLREWLRELHIEVGEEVRATGREIASLEDGWSPSARCAGTAWLPLLLPPWAFEKEFADARTEAAHGWDAPIAAVLMHHVTLAWHQRFALALKKWPPAACHFGCAPHSLLLTSLPTHDAQEAVTPELLGRARFVLEQQVLPALQLQAEADPAHPPTAASLLSSIPLGFTTGDEQLDLAATMLRLLYLQDLRQLQNQVDEAIAAMQEVTANPRTGAAEGRLLGRQ